MQSRKLFLFLVTLSGALLAGSPALGADGKRLYQQNCAACHGHEGRGGVGVPLALDDFLANATDEYLFETIRRGRPGRVMPAFENLSDEEVTAIVEHVRGWQESERETERPEPPHGGDPRRGEKLFQQNCASCHGANGEGGSGTGVTFSRSRDQEIMAPALNNSGFLAAADDVMIKDAILRGRDGTPMPSAEALGLSESDVDDIVTYIRDFEGGPDPDEPESVEEAVFVEESPYDLERTVEAIKVAVEGHNFRLVDEQYLDEGMVPEGEENERRVMLFFCNFDFLYDAMSVDPRVGLFLPCRVTVAEHEGTVRVMSIQPKKLSILFNNTELDRACEEMEELYRDILREGTL